ncbi:transcriptional regulator [Yersinia phage vB_YenM_P744]
MEPFNVPRAILYGMNHLGMNNYTQVWKRVGIHSSTLSSYMSGKNIPSLYILECFASFFGVKLSEFIAWGELDLSVEKLKEEILEWRRPVVQKQSGRKYQ